MWSCAEVWQRCQATRPELGFWVDDAENHNFAGENHKQMWWNWQPQVCKFRCALPLLTGARGECTAVQRLSRLAARGTPQTHSRGTYLLQTHIKGDNPKTTHIWGTQKKQKKDSTNTWPNSKNTNKKVLKLGSRDWSVWSALSWGVLSNWSTLRC